MAPVASWLKQCPAHPSPQHGWAPYGAEVVQRALADMGRALRIDTPTIALVCKYVGTEEEDAPLNSISRAKYEWCLADFGSLPWADRRQPPVPLEV